MIELPEAFINKMEELLGEQYSGFIESYNERANQGLTVNTLKIDIKIFKYGSFDLTLCRGQKMDFTMDTGTGRENIHTMMRVYTIYRSPALWHQPAS